MKKKKKNILIFIPKIVIGGGAERVAVDLGEGLSIKYKVYFLTLHQGDVKMENLTCLAQSESFWSRFFGVFVNVYNVAKFCRKNNIDVVISHLPRTNTSAAIAKFLHIFTGRVLLVTHSANHNGWQNIVLMKLFWNFADKNICVSNGVEGELNNIGIKNTITIYNPIDFKRVDTMLGGNIKDEDAQLFDEKKYTFINVGRLTEAKGQKYLLDAFAKAHKKNKNTQLIILGEGELRNNLEAQITQLSLQNSVHLLGLRENVFPYLKASNCFVFSSLWEGLPTVLIEAAYVGLPIVSTDCKTGPKEILNNFCLSNSYRLVKTRNSVLLYNAMLDCYNFEKCRLRSCSFEFTTAITRYESLL